MGNELLEMNRRQRRGAIVVLAVIALLLLATVAVRSCGTETPREAANVDLPLFEAQADSAMRPAAARPAKRPHSPKHKPSRPRQDKRKRPLREPRPVDPVPQF